MKTKTFSACLLALALAGPAFASQSLNVRVTKVVPNNAGSVLVFVDTPRTGAPACATRGAQAWSFSATTLAGQGLLATVLTALSTGLPVDIGGVAVCDVYNDTESLGWIAISK